MGRAFCVLDGGPSAPVLRFSGWQLPGFYVVSAFSLHLEHLLKQMKSNSSNNHVEQLRIYCIHSKDLLRQSL